MRIIKLEYEDKDGNKKGRIFIVFTEFREKSELVMFEGRGLEGAPPPGSDCMACEAK